MEDKIICPKCHKQNGIQKFCIYCGHQLLDTEQIELIRENPEPYCLNCGRPVKKDQTKCECGYEFRIVDCPKCNAKNAYANRFCTDCGAKLWSASVSEISYAKIKPAIFKDNFPREMRNTILHSRYRHNLNINFPDDLKKIGNDKETLKSNESMVEYNLGEILSRWKIISPRYCINCFAIMNEDEYCCRNCATNLSDAKRVEEIKNMKYKKPVFDMVQLKWNSKFADNYLDSLAPAMGESQFEYRERLKWEFAENNKLKSKITVEIEGIIKREKELEERRRKAREIEKREEELKRQQAEKRKREEEYIRQYGGGYCSSACRHYYEEYFDSRGAIVGDIDDEGYVEYNCNLGHSVSFGSFCKDYKY